MYNIEVVDFLRMQTDLGFKYTEYETSFQNNLCDHKKAERLNKQKIPFCLD